MKTIQIASILVALALAAVACGSDDGSSSGSATCLSQCDLAQASSCTSISDCGAFCSSAPKVAGKSNCGSQWSAYEDCGGAVQACEIDSKCGSQQQAFTTCAQTWCASNASDADCATLAGSL